MGGFTIEDGAAMHEAIARGDATFVDSRGMTHDLKFAQSGGVVVMDEVGEFTPAMLDALHDNSLSEYPLDVTQTHDARQYNHEEFMANLLWRNSMTRRRRRKPRRIKSLSDPKALLGRSSCYDRLAKEWKAHKLEQAKRTVAAKARSSKRLTSPGTFHSDGVGLGVSLMAAAAVALGTRDR